MSTLHAATERIALFDINALFARSTTETVSTAQPSPADSIHSRASWSSRSSGRSPSPSSHRSSQVASPPLISEAPRASQHEKWRSSAHQEAEERLRRKPQQSTDVYQLDIALQDARLEIMRLQEQMGAIELRSRGQIDHLKEQLQSAFSEQDRTKHQLFQERKQWQQAVDELTQRHEKERQALKDTRSTLEQQVVELQNALRSSQEAEENAQRTILRLKKQDVRLVRIEELETELTHYHDEMLNLKEALDQLSQEYSVIDKDHAALKTQHQQLQHENEMLRQDKQHLEKQLAQENNTSRILNAQLSDLQLKLRKTEQLQRDTQLQLETKLSDQRQELEEVLSARLTDMRQRNEAEMEAIKRSNEAVQLREIELMRRDRDQAMQAHAVVQAKLESLERRHAEEVQTSMARIHDLESRLSQLQADIKLTAFDHDRTNMLLEEKRKESQTLGLQVERLQQEVKLVRDEYQRLELSSSSQIETLRGRLSEANTKVAAFAKFEAELDQVVMSAAESSDPQQLLLSYGYGTDAHRRVQKTVELARQVLEARKTISALKEREEALALQLQDTQAQLQEAQTLVNNSSQPLSYFMHMLTEKDEAVRLHATENAKLRQQLADQEKISSDLAHEREALQRCATAGARHEQHLRDLRDKFSAMLQTLQVHGEDSLISSLSTLLTTADASFPSKASRRKFPEPVLLTSRR
eukprot:m.136356 g.136356  ORF g.136356 m.136356 type:complete len:698 (+) comp15872_c2_seq4:1208-3301(+)